MKSSKTKIKTLALSLLSVSIVAYAVERSFNADGSVFNTNTLVGASAFIRTTVNRNVARWVPGDVVHISQGNLTSSFTYTANGNFSPSGQATRIRRRDSTKPEREAN